VTDLGATVTVYLKTACDIRLDNHVTIP